MAATLQDVSGYVAVNRGDGARVVRDAVELRVGDMVIARDGGSAVVVYQDGCRVQVDAIQTATVLGEAGGLKDGDVERSPCSAGLETLPLGQVPLGFTLGAGAIVAGASASIISGIGDANEVPPASP